MHFDNAPEWLLLSTFFAYLAMFLVGMVAVILVSCNLWSSVVPYLVDAFIILAAISVFFSALMAKYVRFDGF